MPTLYLGLVSPISSPWQVVLARLECALPFLPEPVTQVLVLRSLRRLWRAHVRDLRPGAVDAAAATGTDELLRSAFAGERHDFLLWIARQGHRPLGRAAELVLAATRRDDGALAGDGFGDADHALALLDACLPAADPIERLAGYVRRLQGEDRVSSRPVPQVAQGQLLDRPTPERTARAASLAIAVRPQLFGLGDAPLALAGVLPPVLFDVPADVPLDTGLRAAVQASAGDLRDDFVIARRGVAWGEERLGSVRASSSVRDCWRLLLALGPATRAELARALGMQQRILSQAVAVLADAGLVKAGADDAPLIAEVPGPLR